MKGLDWWLMKDEGFLHETGNYKHKLIIHNKNANKALKIQIKDEISIVNFYTQIIKKTIQMALLKKI